MNDDINLLNIEKRADRQDCIIKVIGVGGGGGNAVNHMYEEGIQHVSFALCNTDKQALEKSPIPMKLQLGKSGLGAGSIPEKAYRNAEESIDSIKELLSDGTKLVFITAGMGGGTGTGAAPVVAKTAKEMGILTVGIVTIPFLFESKAKILQALKGVDEISKNVDALLVINNERLRAIYPDFTMINAFKTADDTLTIAAKSIVDIIYREDIMNCDFEDVCTTLSNGGVAIISSGVGDGDNRVAKAIEEALHSPLLNNTDIFKAKKILLILRFSENGNFMMEEMGAIHTFMEKFNRDVNVIWGYGLDNDLDQKVKVTILASGFGTDEVDIIAEQGEEELLEIENKLKSAYGDMLDTPKECNIFIFSPDNMDDDDVISMVETSPTVTRDRATLKSFSQKAVENAPDETDTEETIKF